MGEHLVPYKGRDAKPVIDKALELYDQGIEIEDAAKELGVPARTIHRWLATNATEQWKEAQQGRAQADYEAARKHREVAASTLNALKEQLGEEGVNEAAERNWRLAHAREVLRAADTQLDHQKWLLERLLAKLYGPGAPQQSGNSVHISIGIRRNTDTVDAEVVSESKG
jgi:predicted ArsR family transcriptional regulator